MPGGICLRVSRSARFASMTERSASFSDSADASDERATEDAGVSFVRLSALSNGIAASPFDPSQKVTDRIDQGNELHRLDISNDKFLRLIDLNAQGADDGAAAVT